MFSSSFFSSADWSSSLGASAAFAASAALGVAAGVVFGDSVPFVGGVLSNLIDLVNMLGEFPFWLLHLILLYQCVMIL